MITRTLNLRHVLGPVLGLAGFAVALAATSNATAQDGAAPAASAPAADSAAAPATSAAPAPASTEDESKKKAASAAADPAAAPAPTAAPATGAGAGTGTTITIGGGASGEPKKDEPSKPADTKDEDEKPNPWRGSLFVFDQSTTTNTFSKSAQLSYQPVYEWWISPRINYNITDKVRVNVRQDVFKEFTNTTESTYRGEWRYTDTWLSLAYSDKLKPISDKLRYGVSMLLRPGISKESRIASQYFSLAASGNVGYSFDLAGEKAKLFKSMSVGAFVQYGHAFSKCTTPCSGNFERPRQTADNAAITDNQVRSGSLTGNTLLYAANVGIDIADHLEWSGMMIWISQFAYHTTDISSAQTGEIGHASDDTRLRQLSWFLTQVTYGVTKDVDLALGYYNLNGVLGPDAKYRNPFWSPEARVFFDVNIHLDALYDRLFHNDEPKKGHKGAASRVM